MFATAKRIGFDPVRWLAGKLEILPLHPNGGIDSAATARKLYTYLTPAGRWGDRPPTREQ